MRRYVFPLALAPMALAPLNLPVAQEGGQEAGGLTASLTVGQRLEYENRVGSTPNDEGFATTTDLGLVIESRTSTQSLRFTVDTGLRYEINDNGRGERLDLDDPILGLAYSAESRATRLSFDARYQRSDVIDAAFDGDELNLDDDVLTGTGTRTNSRLGARLELGRDRPLGADLNYAIQRSQFSDTSDPSLVDLDTTSYGIALRFDVNEQIQLGAFYNHSDRDADGPGSSDRLTDRFGLRATYQISPTTQARAELFYSEIESDDNAGNVAGTDGAGFSFGLTHLVQNGNFTFDLSQQETVNGTERQVRLGRSLTFPRGSASLSLGLNQTEGLSVEPLIGLSVGYELDPVSRLSLNLSQSVNIDDDNDTTINSRLSLAYNRQLGQQSQLSAEISIADRNVQTTGGQDRRQTQLSLSHQYLLGRDVSLVSGYSYSETKSDGLQDVEQSRVFVGLQRTFNFRP